MTTLNVILHATLKDKVGRKQIAIDINLPADLATIKEVIGEQFPILQENMDYAHGAINHEFAFDETIVEEDDEVSFFPSVSGGDHPEYAELTILAQEPINLDDLTAQIVSPETGAVALFSGYVRGSTQTEDGTLETLKLEYEAYEPMAIKKMQQVIDEIREQWPLVQGIAVVQRLGTLAVGQPTVLIACSSGHRDQGCFEAARYGIDRLKQIVPVWKKEIGKDGSAWVEGNYTPTPSDRSD